MKKVLLSLIFVAVIVATCLNFAACTDAKTTQNVYDNAESYLAGSQTYAATELTTMTVDWLKGEVVLVEDENATEITVVEENELEEDKKVHSYFHDDILEVRFWKSGHKGVVAASDKKVKITYPSVENLYVNVASGSVRAEKINCLAVKIKQASGTVSFDDVVCTSIEVEKASGNLTIPSLVCDNFTVMQASGSTLVGECEVTSVTAEEASGSIEMNLKKADNVSAKLTSGSVAVKIPECGASVSLKKISGSFSTDLTYTVENGKYIFGKGQCNVKVEMTSGNVTIK